MHLPFKLDSDPIHFERFHGRGILRHIVLFKSDETTPQFIA